MYINIDFEEMQTAVHKALRAWRKSGDIEDDLLLSLQLIKKQKTAVSDNVSNPIQRLAINHILLAGINTLAQSDARSANILKQRFPNDKTVAEVSYSLNLAEDTVYRLQRKAINALTEIILKHETECRQIRVAGIESQLPPAAYSRLFGVDHDQEKLLNQLLTANSPWLISLVGIGGIGKTALADIITRQVIHYFYYEDIIWLRLDPDNMSGRFLSPEQSYEFFMIKISEHLMPEVAGQIPFSQRVTQVRNYLKQRPYLIIIDNLESEKDTAYLLERLNDLAQPSKFLITTRTRPPHQAIVYQFSLRELPLAAAVAFMRYHAQEIGVMDVATATEEELLSIYQVVGGNPLALKLVVGLLDIYALPRVLADLAASRSGEIEDLYQRIYMQTWQTLSSAAKMLLQTMLLVSEAGGLIDYLQDASNLTPNDFWPAVHELRNRSLLEVRGTLQEKRYGIHRLTRTFLQTEIVDWPGDE